MVKKICERDDTVVILFYFCNFLRHNQPETSKTLPLRKKERKRNENQETIGE
jgi:hypothetical protein